LIIHLSSFILSSLCLRAFVVSSLVTGGLLLTASPLEGQTGGNVLAESGETLLRAGRPNEAIPVFRQALEFSPNSVAATLGLARALAATGRYEEALLRYDECLQRLPDNYDALQGKAYVLNWRQRFAEARTIFESLRARQPSDPQNVEALANIARAEEESRWAARRPTAGSPPPNFLGYYWERLELDPHHHQAMMGLAHTQVELRQNSAAIETLSRVVAEYPGDRDAKLALARLLSWDHQYDQAARLYDEVLSTASEDIEALEGLARVLTWSGHLQDAVEAYKRLVALSPDNTAYVLELATLQSRLGNFSDARQTFASLLAIDPRNRQARLQLAQIEVRQGEYDDALRHFERLLKRNPEDFDARLGEARVYYYRGSLGRARTLASALRKEQPDNFDVLFLLAAIQRARRSRWPATALLDRCDRLSPNNPEVAALRERVRDESPVVLHTTAAYARETGRAYSPSSPEQDLRNFDFGTRLDLALLPRSDSSLSFSYLPSSIRAGGGTGAPPASTVGPSEFMYRQTTRVSRLLTVRGGAGLVRFGPGGPQMLPGNPDPVSTAALQPIGFVGFSLLARRDLSFDLNWTRSAITYTPLSVRLGVIAENVEGSLNYLPTPRTELRLNYYQGLYFSQMYEHVTYGTFEGGPVRIVATNADHQRGRGGSIVFSQNLVRSPHLAWDLGYWGLAFGFNGPSHHVYYMGFFTPSFYQRQLLTTRLQGKLWGPLGYDFSGGIGVQQLEQGQPLLRALTLSPAFTLRASPRVSLRLKYTHYDSAPGLGQVSGNAVQLSTDFKF
jgi:tetratricopeptide (TPR) repeat protein